MRTHIIGLAALLAAVPAAAAPITESHHIISTGVWSKPDPTAFYGGLSWDGAEAGIGFQLAGLPDLEYLNDGSGGAVPFLLDGYAVFKLMDKIGDYETLNTLSWVANGQQGTIFTGADTNGTLKGVQAPIPYALQLGSPEGVFTSWGDDTFNHFALFRSASLGLNCVGIEDLRFTDRNPPHDGDYQDQVSCFTFKELPTITQRTPEEPKREVPVPEPATVALLGVGLAYVARRARR